jgi:hypothetical protein
LGVLTDLVVVNLSQVQAIAESSSPANDLQGIDIRGIDPVKLCELKTVLMARPDDGSWIREFEFVAGNKEEGPWVMRFPSDLAAAIAGIPGDKVESTAAAWIGTGAFELDNWNEMDVIEVLWAMRTLFTAKLGSSVAPFLWMSL